MRRTKTHLLLTTILLQFILVYTSFSQSTGYILIISNINAKVIVDGDEIGQIDGGTPGKFEISEGEHYLQVISIASDEEKNEIINIKSGKQKVIKYEFGKSGSKENIIQRILVADIDFTIPGIVTANAQEDFEYPTFLYAFEKGDEIIINIEMYNAKGTNVIEVFTYPDGNTKYSNDSFQDIKDFKITVNERSIYGFSFASNHAFDRDARLVVERIPESETSVDFNPAVSWKETYRVEVVQKPQKFFVNSGSNAAFEGGKSRIVLPVNFPENTIKWYFTFSASRDESQIESDLSAFSLASELSTIIDQTGLLSFGINQITQPPGADYCDIYLLDHENSSLFTLKQDFSYFTEGTRENYKAGVIEVECCINLPTYLGIRNPNNFHGIHVVIEVAAIVKKEDWVMHHKD